MGEAEAAVTLLMTRTAMQAKRASAVKRERAAGEQRVEEALAAPKTNAEVEAEERANIDANIVDAVENDRTTGDKRPDLRVNKVCVPKLLRLSVAHDRDHCAGLYRLEGRLVN